MSTERTAVSIVATGSVPPPTSLGDGLARRFVGSAPKLARRTGRIAEEATLVTRMNAAIADGDTEAERLVCLELAKLLENRGIGLGSAAELYTRAASIAPSAEVSRKLAALEEKLGRPDRAAEALRRVIELDPQVGGRVRLGWLLLRAGDFASASVAFARAAAETQEPLAIELRGALAFTGSGHVSREEGAGSYLDASARRAGADQADAELDDLARAYALSPSIEVGERLARALARRNKPLLADAFLEGFVLGLPESPERTRAIADLRAARLANGDMWGGLLLALASPRELRETDAFDDLLLRAGMPEMLAEHLAVRASAAPVDERVRLLTERMRILAGPLADPSRALSVAAEILALSATDEEALGRLTSLAGDGATSPRAVALLVAKLCSEAAVPAELADAAARLGELLDNPALRVVALRAALRTSDDPRLRASLAAAETRCNERLEPGSRPLTVEAKRARLVALLTLVDRRDEQVAAVSELDGTEPYAVEIWTLAVERSLATADAKRAVLVATSAVARARTEEDADRAKLLLARAELEAGAPSRALSALVGEVGCATAHAPLALLLAVDLDDTLALARAAEAMAKSSSGKGAAAFRRIACRAYAVAGDAPAARRLASDLRDADPGDLLTAALVAEVHLRKRVEASAAPVAFASLEAANALLWPDARRIEALASLASEVGDASAALSYGQRLIGLRPADPAPLATFLDRLIASGDATRIAESLGWVLSLPYPAALLAETLVTGLDALEGDPERRMMVARRAFDVLGPTFEPLLEKLVDIGKRSNDFAFSAQVLERALSCGVGRGEGATPGAGYIALSELYARALDTDGEVRALVSALRDGADVEGLDARLGRFEGAALGGDAELACLDALSERAAGKGGDEAALSLRKLGAALWDLAGDRPGALAAWVDAARRAPFRGQTTLRRDLVEFAGREEALECLVALAEHEPDAARAGSLFAEAARVAVALGDEARTFDLAARALRKNPAHTDALTSAEAGARADDRNEPLSQLYAEVAARALGRFGRRAAHFRAARFFESRGAFPLAVEHATSAFLAVPSEGSALQLLARAGERAGDPAAVFDAVDRLAGVTKSAAQRAAWLVRASELGDLQAGLAERTDALLRALVLVPDARTLEKLAAAFERQVADTPGDADVLVLRLTRAARAVLPKCEGPEGARVAVRVAELAVKLAGDLVLSWDAIERAFVCDGDIDEYKNLVALVPRLCEAEGARAAFGRAVTISEKPYSSLGAAAFALLGALAARLGEGVLSRKWLVSSVTRDSDDALFVVLADEALAAFPDAEDLRRFQRHVPVERLVEALVAVVESAPASDAVLSLTRIVRAKALAPSDAPASLRSRLAELEGAFGEEPDALSRRLEAADVAGDLAIVGDTLEKLAASTRAPAALRVPALLRLSRAIGESEPSRASGYLRKAAELSPGDDDVDAALEEHLDRKGAYEDLAAHLGAKVARLSLDPARREAVRVVRLRRAALLEQRLGKVAEARAELEALLVAHPDSESALRYLADLAERAGDLGATVELLGRLSTAVPDTRDEVELRVAKIRFAEGRIEEARALVGSVLSRGEPLDAVRLRVEMARKVGDPRDLGDALAQLARAGADDAEVRSEILVEAAQAAARAGDVEVSLRRAQEAARVAPQVASVQLFARGLEYRTRGPGTPDEARGTLSSLAQVRAHLMPADIALRAFLMAEASRVLSGGGAGLELLLETRAELGPHALLALGMAERLASQGRHEDALVAFDEAIAGPLLGMRRVADVQLSASASAEKLGDLSLALRYAESAMQEPELRLAGLERVRRLAFAFGDVRKQRSALRQLVALQQGDLRIEAMKDLAGSLLASGEAVDRDEGRSLLETALRETPRGRAAAEELRSWLERLDAEALAAKDEPPKAAPPKPEEAAPPTEAVASASAPSTPEPPVAAPTPAEAARRDMAEIFGTTMVSAGQGSRVTEPVGPLPDAPIVHRVVVEVPPASVREVLSSDDIEEAVAIEVAKAPPLPAAATRDPFPEAFTTKDPFPSASPPSVGPASVIGRDTFARAEGSVRIAGSSLLTLPSLLPHVLEGVKKGLLPDARTEARLAEARQEIADGHQPEAEGLLAEAISGGSVEAADVLAEMLAPDPERTALYLRARRQAAELAPGNKARLHALRDAARADNNTSYVRALEHLIGCLEGDAELPEPPPLHQQTEQPGMLALLTRAGREGIGEAFGLVWEFAAATFVRNAPASMSGLDRVTPSDGTAAGRLLESAARLLGLTSARISRRRVPGAKTLTAHVALGQPPSGILHGLGDEEPPELAFVLGQALGASLPPHALLFGQTEGDAKVLFRALLGAFGPPEAARDLDRATASLGEILWQTLPAKAQRRLSDLLSGATLASFDDALARARQASLRVGLFVSGDFRQATRAVLLGAGQDPRLADANGAVMDLVSELPELADLYRLALRPELADARFAVFGRTGRPGTKVG